MVQCTLKGLANGDTLCLTPIVALRLVEKKIIVAEKKLGFFKVVKDAEDALWRELRKAW
jgi:hypothetical protein